MTLFERDEGPAKVKLVVAYDGSGFHGWAEQPEVRTVEGVLTRALERFLRHPPERLTCAGRTDAGVHAWGQVVSFDADPGIDPWRLQSAVNGALAPEVVVRAADVVEPDFDARRSACWRAYRYTVLNRPVTDPFFARYAWWVPAALDVRALRLGADPFVGEHDFASFCRQGPEGSTTTRRVLESRWHDLGEGVLRYDIRATAFCWQMVRSIVGTLVEVGTGKKRPGELMGILRAKNRSHAGSPAPPEGLCLWEVGYS